MPLQQLANEANAVAGMQLLGDGVAVTPQQHASAAHSSSAKGSGRTLNGELQSDGSILFSDPVGCFASTAQADGSFLFHFTD